MNKKHWLAIGALCASSSYAAQAREPILAPCDRCELIYHAMPGQIQWLGVLKSAGAPLQVRGTVRDAAGRPTPNIVVYIHHTNAQGIYPGATRAEPHGTLRAWARTDALGRYGFDTIRPAAYPAAPDQRREPAHIHMQILEPGRCSYYIDDLLFADDPLLTPARRSQALLHPRAGRGLQHAIENAGVWQIERDVVLGQNVAAYPQCAEQAQSQAQPTRG